MNQQTLNELLAQYPMKTPFVFFTGSPSPMSPAEFFARLGNIVPGTRQLGEYINEAIANFM